MELENLLRGLPVVYFQSTGPEAVTLFHVAGIPDAKASVKMTKPLVGIFEFHTAEITSPAGNFDFVF
jgi:hypothetical protein